MSFHLVRVVVATRCCFGKMFGIQVMGFKVRYSVFMVTVFRYVLAADFSEGRN